MFLEDFLLRQVILENILLKLGIEADIIYDRLLTSIDNQILDTDIKVFHIIFKTEEDRNLFRIVYHEADNLAVDYRKYVRTSIGKVNEENN